jgi:hypothetical protein
MVGFYYICLELGNSAHHDHEADESGASDAGILGSSHSFPSHTAHLSGYYYSAEKDMCDQYVHTPLCPSPWSVFLAPICASLRMLP